VLESEYGENILCIHVQKWKNKTWWNYSKNGGIKENNEGGKFN
jgi:hypothetical protein